MGVVGVVKQYGLDIDTKMVTYFPYATWMNGQMFAAARTTGDPTTLSNSMIEQVHALDSDIPVFDIATMQERVHDSLARQRFAMTKRSPTKSASTSRYWSSATEPRA